MIFTTGLISIKTHSMFDYLYYKLYKASLKSSLGDIPEFLSSVFLGGLISANILVISAFLDKINVFPFIFSSSKGAGLFYLILIILMMFIYKEKRRKAILKKYSQETNKERIKGNVIVITYVIISFLLIFGVAFFRPGKL
jgi:hypothetical protein